MNIRHIRIGKRSVVPGALVCARAECGVRDIRPLRRDVLGHSPSLTNRSQKTTAVVKSRATMGTQAIYLNSKPHCRVYCTIRPSVFVITSGKARKRSGCMSVIARMRCEAVTMKSLQDSRHMYIHVGRKSLAPACMRVHLGG